MKLNVAALEPAEGAKAKVVMFKLDDKGEKATTAFKTVAAAEIKENVVTVDLSAETVGDADYAFVVTVGDNEDEVTETLEFKAVEKLVADINKATTTAAQLATLLNNETYFTGFDIAKVDAYNTNNTKNFKTVAEVQEKVIDAAVEAEEFVAFAKAVNEATGNYAKYVVLTQTEELVYLDDANMNSYLTKFILAADALPLKAGEFDTASYTDFKAVQDEIDQINLDAVATKAVATDGSEKLSELNEYKAALEALQLVNEDLVAKAPANLTKANLIKAIDAELVKIDEAKGKALEVITAAEQAMADYELAIERDINATDTEHKAVADAIEALEVTLAKEDVTENAIKAYGTDKLLYAGGGATTDLIAPLKAATLELTIINDTLVAVDEFKTAFKVNNDTDFKLETVYTAIFTGANPILVETSAGSGEYKFGVDSSSNPYTSADLITGTTGPLADLRTATKEWNAYNAVLAAKTGSEMRSALVNIDNAGADFMSLSSAAKTEFAEYVLDKLGKETTKPATFALLQTKVLGSGATDYLKVYSNLIGAVNLAGTIPAMMTALDALEIEAYDDLGVEAQADVADLVLENDNAMNFKTIAEIVAAMGL